MDFDTAKENIQPLRQGRRADRLEIALGEQSKESLENEKRQIYFIAICIMRRFISTGF